MSDNICCKLFCDASGKLLKSKLGQAIQSCNANAECIVVSRHRDVSTVEHLTKNPVRDLKILMSFDANENINNFWLIFIRKDDLKYEIVDTFVERYQFWQWRTRPIFATLNACLNHIFNDKNIFSVIVNFLSPQPPALKFDPAILKQKQYKDIVVSDQDGGLLCCGKCVVHEYNPIWHIDTCPESRLKAHIQLHSHLQ